MTDFNNYDLPDSLNVFLSANSESLGYFLKLRPESREEIIRRSHDFSSEEEFERYLYHLENEE